jgi:FkbM family methyltransferase
LLRHGVAPAIEHLQLLATLEVDHVIDVGANRGQFSLLARHLYPDATIIAFEPLADAGARWRSVFANDGNARLVPVALGADSRAATMFVTADGDSSSLLRPKENQTFHYPSTTAVGSEVVRVERLDEAGAMPAAGTVLLKLDVQGHELEVLRGAGEILTRIAYVYSEVSFVELYADQPLASDVNSFLVAAGFSLLGIGNVGASDADGSIIQADLLYGRSATSPEVARHADPGVHHRLPESY